MTLGIRGKLFLVSLGLITLSVIAADAYLTIALRENLTERIRDDLFARLRFIEHDATSLGAALDDLPAWDALADHLGRRAEGRVTIIRRDGLVLGDSEVDIAALGGVENHAQRPEIVAALSEGRGSTVRWSSTVRQSMLYAATPFIRDGEIAGTVRLAKPLTEVDAAVDRLQSLVFAATAIALLLAVFMSSLVSHWISKTVRTLTAAAHRMAAGDLSARTRAAGADEIAEMGRALDRLAGSLEGALDSLRTERDLMNRVLQGMREGVLLLDRDGRVGLANPALREMLLLEADLVGKSPLEVIRHAELKRVLDQATSGMAPVSAELEIGTLKPRSLLVHASPLPDEPGGLLVVFVDVTDLRRLETVRRDFVANVSHELRTPVASMRSAAETLRQALAAQPQAAVEFIDIIERNADRLHRLIEDLLDLSRIESREFRLDLEPTDLGSFIRHTLSLFVERAQARHVRLLTEVPSGVPPARADRRALEQVLSNLVDNALKYGSEGTSVTVRATAEDETLRVSVEDKGPGIEERHLHRLFERFYRVDAGRSRDLGGTGLGLSIVKHLVEAMSGRVSVESTPGKGTCFSFTLPAAYEEVSTPRP